MITHPLGTRRLVRRLVIRKKIGEEVRYLQICCWEEEYLRHQYSDGWNQYFTATKFISEYEFNMMLGGKGYADVRRPAAAGTSNSCNY
jgi:hypothetical protein